MTRDELVAALKARCDAAGCLDPKFADELAEALDDALNKMLDNNNPHRLSFASAAFVRVLTKRPTPEGRTTP